MMSEKGKVKSEKFNSPLSRGDKGGCKNPLSRGDKGGCVDGALMIIRTQMKHRTTTEHTPISPLPEALGTGKLSVFRNPDTSGRGLFPALILVIGLLTLYTQPVIAQGVGASQVTPPPDRNALSGYSPQGETSYPQLEKYLQIAIEQNPELQSMRAMLEADRERVREAGVLMDPEITVAYDFNPMMYDSQLGRFSVSAMQMFPWFGTLETRRDLQRSAADVNRAEIGSRQLEILRDVQLAWFDIAEIREQIRITKLTLELVRDLEKLVEARYETGRTGQADILRIQMEEQRLQTRIADLEDRINPLTARFNELLNRDAKTYVETTDELRHTDLAWSDEEVKEQIRQQNPVFDGIEAERSAAEKERRLAELDGRPGFGIGVEVMGRDFGPMSMFPDARESIVGMATVRVPLFRSRYDSQKRQADHRIRSLYLREHQTENRLIAELEQYLEEIRRSERTVTLLSEELVPRAQQALTILSEEYSVGNARFDELLQIQRELLDLEFERIEAVVRQNQAVVRVESLMGYSPP
ncbi:MAG: TolC family protein [Balneolaceae bacterium]|nr:MAG: TolC family protein [Balneolaceae bacterium]